MIEKIKKNIYEILVYISIWVVFVLLAIFLIDDDGLRMRSNDDIVAMLSDMVPLFVIFLIHSLIIIPAFLAKNKLKQYLVSLFALLLVALAFFYYQDEQRRKEFDKMRTERIVGVQEGRNKPGKLYMVVGNPDEHDRIGRPRDGRKPGRRDTRVRSLPHTPHWVGPVEAHMLIAILMLGGNIAVNLLFRARRDEQRMRKMENEHLKHELEYLKFQINPHFFMNTLNNIHALVDIDSAKAKDAIVELSRLMRYVLYDGSAEHIPLNKEVMFIQHYIELMRLRYDDSVDIDVNVHGELPNKEIPPMLLITFIENAFKHGISYQTESYVHVDISYDEQCDSLLFACENSKIPPKTGNSIAPPQHKESGIGLDNVKKRLALIYPDSHKLDITETDSTFKVNLELTL